MVVRPSPVRMRDVLFHALFVCFFLFFFFGSPHVLAKCLQRELFLCAIEDQFLWGAQIYFPIYLLWKNWNLYIFCRLVTGENENAKVKRVCPWRAIFFRFLAGCLRKYFRIQRRLFSQKKSIKCVHSECTSGTSVGSPLTGNVFLSHLLPVRILFLQLFTLLSKLCNQVYCWTNFNIHNLLALVCQRLN